MKTCPHCRIQVGGDGLYCPLCHTPLAGAADPGGEAPYFQIGRASCRERV